MFQNCFLKKTNIFWFCLYILIAAALFVSWFIPTTAAFWDTLDSATFQYLNSSLKEKPLVQIFWALANYRPVDIFGALFMTLFFFMHILDSTSLDERLKRISQLMYALIWGELGILFTKQLLGPCLETLGYFRESPSLVFPDVISLAKAIPWLTVKDCSPACFPSDHAQIVLQWMAFMLFYMGIRKGSLAFTCGIFFMLPRLIAGAHWLSDICIGSIPIVLLIMAIATRTPLYTYGTEVILKYLRLYYLKTCRKEGQAVKI